MHAIHSSCWVLVYAFDNRDLVETSAKLCREIKQEEFKGEIKRMVEEQLLDALTGSQVFIIYVSFIFSGG